MTNRAMLVALLPVFVVAAGCEVAKSSNPLSPSVAGPIAGVAITAPKPLEPINGSEVEPGRPLTLLIENPSSSGVRPLSLLVEVASDTEFTNKVLSRDGITPGEGGRTTVTLSERLESGRTYHWRVRAQDGANTGPFSAASSFKMMDPASLTTPVPLSPINGATISALRPSFAFSNANRSGAVGSVSYTVELARDQAMTQVVAVVTVGEQGGQTSFTLAQDLELGKQYFWRVRASDGRTTSQWSAIQSFFMPSQPPASPTPPPAPAPPSGGTPSSCVSSDINAILRCVSSKYPDKRAPVGSLSQRQANIAFLRDRIIEAGICGGLDLGLNLKYGGPEISTDFIVHRQGGVDRGYDFAFASKNIGMWVELQWMEGHSPFYKAYSPRPSCK